MRKVYCNFSPEVFPGFYDTDLVWTEDYDGEIAEKFRRDYFFTFRDFEKYKAAAAREWLSQMSASLDEGGNPLGLVIRGIGGVWSPKEYNWYTDQLLVDVQFDLRRLARYCLAEKRAEFDSYLRENWSDRPGFYSFIPDSADAFERQLREGKDRDSLTDVMIEFYLLREVDFRRVDMAVNENLYEIQAPFLAMEGPDGGLYKFEHTDGGYVPLAA